MRSLTGTEINGEVQLLKLFRRKSFLRNQPSERFTTEKNLLVNSRFSFYHALFLKRKEKKENS